MISNWPSPRGDLPHLFFSRSVKLGRLSLISPIGCLCAVRSVPSFACLARSAPIFLNHPVAFSSQSPSLARLSPPFPVSPSGHTFPDRLRQRPVTSGSPPSQLRVVPLFSCSWLFFYTLGFSKSRTVLICILHPGLHLFFDIFCCPALFSRSVT